MGDLESALDAVRRELDALCRKRRDWGLTAVERSCYAELCRLELAVLRPEELGGVERVPAAAVAVAGGLGGMRPTKDGHRLM